MVFIWWIIGDWMSGWIGLFFGLKKIFGKFIFICISWMSCIYWRWWIILMNGLIRLWGFIWSVWFLLVREICLISLLYLEIDWYLVIIVYVFFVYLVWFLVGYGFNYLYSFFIVCFVVFYVVKYFYVWYFVSRWNDEMEVIVFFYFVFHCGWWIV